MRKIAHSIFALAALLSATAFAAYPTGDYMTWFGSDAGKDMTNSSGTSLYGAWAGEGGEYINYSGFFGALSGYRVYNVNRSLGLGPWALREARNVYGTVAIGTSAGRGIEGCTNCVFIGTNAGRGVTNATDWVDIGGVFRFNGNASGEHLGIGSFYVGREPLAIWVTGELGIMPGDQEKLFLGVARYSGLSHVLCNENTMSITGKHAIFFDEEDYCWKIQGIGELDRHGPIVVKDDLADFDRKDKTDIPITDEDTGEKYIIKVKSGALKLYKVEETVE